MKFTRLELHNFKCFEHLVLDNLGARVVLVGPNGCGKSAVLEAIAALKEFTGSHHYNPSQYVRSIEVTLADGTKRQDNVEAWPAGVPLPIRDTQPFARVSATLELNEAERELANAAEKSNLVTIQIDRSGAVVKVDVADAMVRLFRHVDLDSGAGVVNYIAPDRFVPYTTLGSVTAGSLTPQAWRHEFIQLPSVSPSVSKFASIKQYIIERELQDLSAYHAFGVTQDSLALLREIFAEFFYPKRLIGYQRIGDSMSVAIQTPVGRHDIDELSSGERELFAIFADFHRMRELPSIVLYDEPERHLNAGIEGRVLTALDRLQPNSQIWIATHGLELIGSCPLEDIIALGLNDSGMTVRPIADESDTSRVRIFEALGANVALQFTAKKVVFVEGKDAHSDKRMLVRLGGSLFAGVLFVSSGPASGVMGTGSRAPLLLRQVNDSAEFYMLLDRDYRDDDDVAVLKKRLCKRAFIWDCHEIENLLLKNRFLKQVLDDLDVGSRLNGASVGRALKAAASARKEQYACELAAYRLMRGGQAGDGDEGITRPNNETGYLNFVSANRKRADAIQRRHMGELQTARADVEAWLADGTWRKRLPGKGILDEFRLQLKLALRARQEIKVSIEGFVGRMV